MTVPELLLSDKLGDFYRIYAACWIGFCLFALAIFLREKKEICRDLRAYVRFLCVPWKLVFFAPAFLFVTFAGRFTNDETWDVISGTGMSLLTFVTAPWAWGVSYQALKGSKPKRYLILSLALCLFSSSWFYDGYLFLRDGEYSTRWLGNLMLSPIVYIAAGVFWNLESTEKDKISLSFLRPDWPVPPVDTRFRYLLLVSVPIIFIVAFELIAFVGWHL